VPGSHPAAERGTRPIGVGRVRELLQPGSAPPIARTGDSSAEPSPVRRGGRLAACPQRLAPRLRARRMTPIDFLPPCSRPRREHGRRLTVAGRAGSPPSSDGLSAPHTPDRVDGGMVTPQVACFRFRARDAAQIRTPRREQAVADRVLAPPPTQSGQHGLRLCHPARRPTPSPRQPSVPGSGCRCRCSRRSL